MTTATLPADGDWSDALHRLSDLAVLATLVETRSWDLSASALDTTVAMLRAAIGRLEVDTGGALVRELESRPHPTLLGEACVAHAGWLRDRIRDLPAVLTPTRADGLVVGATPATQAASGDLVTAFRRRHPEVRVELVALDEGRAPDADVVVLTPREARQTAGAPRAVRDEVTIAVQRLGLVSRAFVDEACDGELTRPAYRRSRVLPPR